MSSAMILPAEITDLRSRCLGPPRPHALRILTALGDLGLSAPGDTAGIGFDDTGYGSMTTPAFTAACYIGLLDRSTDHRKLEPSMADRQSKGP